MGFFVLQDHNTGFCQTSCSLIEDSSVQLRLLLLIQCLIMSYGLSIAGVLFKQSLMIKQD